MMVVGLLLAQLVLPGPPSGPIQPPGMICLGECAGPVVWGPAERGRLVVACDMRSDTCSDGRKITTTRATPVPCEVAPGVWEMVGVDEGCYSVRGLEAWAANTSYLAHGASLDQDNWDARSGTTIERVATWWRVSFPQSGSLLTTSSGSIGSAGQSWTAACIAKQGPSGRDSFRMRPFHGQLGVSQYCNDIPLRVEWGLISCTGNTGDAPTASPAVFLDPPSSFIPGDLDVVGCWLPRSDSPGRPCWGGEAAVTCAADRHTISTEGWPTEAGEICITFTLGQEIEGRRLFDTRVGNAAGALAFIRNPNGVFVQWGGVAGNFYGVEWSVGATHRVCLERDADGTTRIMQDGMEMAGTRTMPPLEYGPNAHLGADSAFGNILNGSIRSLRIRSYEEVSP